LKFIPSTTWKARRVDALAVAGIKSTPETVQRIYRHFLAGAIKHNNQGQIAAALGMAQSLVCADLKRLGIDHARHNRGSSVVVDMLDGRKLSPSEAAEEIGITMANFYQRRHRTGGDINKIKMIGGKL